MAVVVKMWHYIWHDLLNALLRFQRVSRSRPLREGKHALELEATADSGIVYVLNLTEQGGRSRKTD
jgi:hypothetical protein